MQKKDNVMFCWPYSTWCHDVCRAWCRTSTWTYLSSDGSILM